MGTITIIVISFFQLFCALICLSLNATQGPMEFPETTTEKYMNTSHNFCNTTLQQKFVTNCRSCILNALIECPVGSVKITEENRTTECRYRIKFGLFRRVWRTGCQHLCLRETIIPRCCPGHYGSLCQACPGGAQTPCSGRGVCNDGDQGNGTCVCQTQFTGSACEECKEEVRYGPNCTGVCDCGPMGTCRSGINGNGSCVCDSGYMGTRCDQAISGCTNQSCHPEAVCTEEDNGEIRCRCKPGYQATDGWNCTATNPCDSHPCHPDAHCDILSPGNHICQCKLGYTGDGLFCDPINPCDNKNDALCPGVGAKCVYVGPGENKCDCLEGYENYTTGLGCVMIDLCQTNRSDVCHKNADCTVDVPGQVTCKCKEGYIGDGKTCYGNIIQRLEELDKHDPELGGKLSFGISMIALHYAAALAEHGPFTLFMPMDWGQANQKQLNLSSDDDLAAQIIRQHILATQMSVQDMRNTTFYTLQGTSAELNARPMKSGEMLFRYRIHGSGRKGKLVKYNIIASNGLIHVIDKLMTNKPETKGDKETSLYELIKKDGKFNRFQYLIEIAGLAGFLNDSSAGNYTVFVANNGAIDAIDKRVYGYLISKEGHGKLVGLLKSHIVEGTQVLAADLINMDRFVSLGNAATTVTITKLGQIRLNRVVNITQTDIPASNGYYHHIDGLLLPKGESILPNRCDKETWKVVKGPCGWCSRLSKCQLDSDIPLKQPSLKCRFVAWRHDGFPWSAHRYRGFVRYPFPDSFFYRSYPRDGCAWMCNRSITVSECCGGYYGSACEPCPGEYNNPCYGNGQCIDGIKGNGTCKCNANFTGSACEICEDPKMFGPGCNQTCTCIEGTCHNTIDGDGKCKPGSCQFSYTGDNCDKTWKVCPAFDKKLLHCHVHAHCEIDRPRRQPLGSLLPLLSLLPLGPRTRYRYMCSCNTGYTGNGRECFPIDPCALPDRGGCHPQAKCIQTGPGKSVCVCDPGWHGDGKSCSPIAVCTVHNDCHPDARCVLLIPGQFECLCNPGFQGNGTYCIATNSCAVHNGGCSEKAMCISTGIGTRNCTCAMGYSGDGLTCLGSINAELAVQQNLTQLTEILEVLEEEDNILNDLTQNYTFFAPVDPAVSAFRKLASFSYWQHPTNVISLIGYHTVPGNHSFLKLKMMTFLLDYFQTLADNMWLNITHVGKDLYVNDAKVIKANIPALNGVIHIIDKVLEPYPVPQPTQPYLLNLLEDRSKYSIFQSYLMISKLLSNISSLDSYTVFVPTNTVLNRFGHKMTSRLLSFYVVPTVLTTNSIEDGMVAETLLGDQYYINISLQSSQIFVNGVPVIEPDLMTYGGVVHGIGGMIWPDVHRCPVEVTKVQVPACCKGYYGLLCDPCPADPIDHPNCRESNNNDTRGNQSVDTNTGSGQGVNTSVDDGHGGCMIQFSGPTCSNCAPGYYGRLCEECPGGAREPCSGHGTCFDGRNGTGHCTCDENFTGKSCDHCVMGKTGDLCSKDINKCLIENGGCHANATCLDEGGKLTCTCMPGFYGNGSKCQHRCQIQNGGCHENATCSLKGPGNEITCICLPGFHGDGIHFCLSPCDVANGGCHSNATCNHENGEVTCTCMSGYLPLGDDCVSACHFENQNCHENATCHSEGPDNRVKCSCLPGFLGDGYHFCHNPCEIDNGGCHGDADCVVQDGHVVCACPVTKTCFDLCTYNNGGCHSNAECMDKSGSVTCSCLPGYHGDGYTCNTPCEILNGGCHVMATCSYSNSSVNCSCISNYIGDGYNCKSVCDIKNGGCHADASCQATPDGVKCTCYPGYHGDGYKCMSPCVVFNGGCHKYAKCSITNDFVSCVCLPGYYGSGYNCYSPCEINNHTCLPEAKCSFDQQKQSYRCKCPTNLTGDGVTYCVEDKCLQQNGGCPPGASCSVALSIDGALTTGHVQCTCKDDFVGNGTICNGDILDTLNRLNETQAFYKVLLTASSTSQELQEMVNSLKTGVGNTTVFVPYRISEGNFSQKALSTAALRNHFVTGAVNLDADQFNNTTLVSLIGQQLKVQFKKQGFYVDGIRVVEANIPATNGIIHIIKQPLELAHISTQKVPGGELPTAGSSTTLIAELIGIIVASILVLAVLVLVYKFWWKKSGKVDILMRFRKEGGLFFERFTHLSEEEPQTSSSHVSENFDNPLYDVQTQQVVLQ